MQIGRNMAPTFVGLSVLQINTFVNTLIAWGLAAAGGPQTIAWLGGVNYPMQQGAVAAALLQRPALRLHAGNRRFAGGGGHLSAVVPPCRPRRPSANGHGHDAGASAGVLPEHPGRRRADAAGQADHTAGVAAGQFHAGRHRSRGMVDRLLRCRRLGKLRMAGGCARILRA